MSSKTPWRDGLYRFKSSTTWLFDIKGESLIFKKTACLAFNVKSSFSEGTIKLGKFGKTTPEIQAKTGKSEYDLEIIFFGGHMRVHAVLNENKQSFTLIEITNTRVDEMWLMDDLEIQKLIESGDPIGMNIEA